VKVPTEVSASHCKDYLDVLHFIIKHQMAPIVKFRDNHSRMCKQFLDIASSDAVERLESLFDLCIFGD
jgi:hypothetical protein